MSLYIEVKKGSEVTISATGGDKGAIYGGVGDLITGASLRKHDNGDITMRCRKCEADRRTP